MTGTFEDHLFPGGHVGVFVSRKAQGVVAGGLSAWLRETQMQDDDGAAPSKTPAKRKARGAKKK